MTCNPHFLKTMSPETPYFAVFCYETEDTAKVVAARNYFLPAIRMLRERDVVVVYADVGQQPSLGIFVVTRRDSEKELIELCDFSKLKIRSEGEFVFKLLPKLKDVPTKKSRVPRKRVVASSKKSNQE